MSFSIKSPINNIKNIEQKKNKNAKKIYNALINVKMFQIPNCIGFNHKVKTNIITSSYFNMNLKNNNKNLMNKKKTNKKNAGIKNDRNKTNHDLKSNYYSLIIANNKKKNLTNNYSKLSMNSLITNSINKTKKQINGRRKKIINEEDYSIINKRKNYSFKIKVKKIKEKLSLTNSRNNSLKKVCHSNDNYHNRQKTIISTESLLNLNNKSELKIKSRNDNKKINNKKLKKKNFRKNYSVKSIFFKKVELKNELNYKNKNNNFNIYLSYSEKDKNKKKIKDKIMSSSNIINNISNVDLINISKYDNLKENNNIYKIHKRNKTTSCNSKIINNLLNNNKKIKKNNKKNGLRLKSNQDFSLLNKKYLNKTNILTNLNIERINLNNKIVISPKNKYGTSIIPRSNIDNFLNEKHYSSISENINNLKSILYNSNNNYISYENKDNNKKNIIIKNIPIPKSTKNNNKVNKEKEKEGNGRKSSNHTIKDIKDIKDIKNIKIKKVSKNKKVNNSKSNKNKEIIKEKEENNSIIKRNNYDRDDFFENEKKSNNNHSKNKISIIDILRQDKNKTIGKKIKTIKYENNKTKKKKFKHYICKNSKDKKNNTNTNNNDSEIKLNIKTIKKEYSKKEEIIKNNIENILFTKNNLISIDDDDPFDDLYSIIKRINFNSISLNDNGIFDDINEDYKNYIKLFNNSYNFNSRKRNTKKIFNSKEKKNSKNFTESTKMNTTSSKKAICFNNKNYSNIREFTLDNNDYINK